MSPAGCITFLRKAYGGRASDKVIFCQSSLLELLAENDAVMVDKGFRITSECEEAGMKLIIPPFLKNKTFSFEEVEQTANIAAARVHVERVIQRMKFF